MQKIRVDNDEKILIIAPHPDDESIGMGGFLSMFAPQIDVWLLTDGCMGGIKGQRHSEVAQIRKTEFEKTMQLAGVHEYRMFNVKDRDLSTQIELLTREELEQYQKIFVTNQNDLHPDHVAAFLVLKYAINKKKDSFSNIEVYQYEVTSPLSDVTHFLEITDDIDKKRSLIGNYISQLQQADYYSIALSLNRFRASVYGKRDRYIETYALTDCLCEFDSSTIEKLMIYRQREKLELLLWCYDRWMQLEMSGIHVSQIIEIGYGNKIWIYGCGLLGKAIYRTTNGDNVNVLGFLDKYLSVSGETDNAVYHPDEVDESEKAYPVIVSAVYDYESIEAEMKERGFRVIVSFVSLIKES